MPRLHTKRQLAFTPDQLMQVVTDVQHYPEFIPWITGIRVWDQTDNEFKAEVDVAYKLFRERFSTYVQLDHAQHTVDITLLKGPFKRLKSHWRLTERVDGSDIEFFIDVDIKIPFLNGILTRGFQKFSSRIIQCFEDRASQLFRS